MELKIDPGVSYALALEGGGARGAYQIGAWRALRQAGVRISAAAGTSVGALNGGLITVGDYDKAEELWENITYSQVIRADDDAMHSLMRGEITRENIRELLGQVGAVIKNRGFDVTPLRNMIRQYVPEETVRAAETELFIVTTSLSDKGEELELRARDLADGELADMLMASAYLPVFRAERLGGKLYADGGFRDVLPLHVLVENGYKHIIAVRLYGTGIERSVRIPRGTELLTVEPSDDLGGTMEFEPESARRNMRMGYYDTMRALYGLQGKKYYIDIDCPEDEARALLVRSAQRVGAEDGWTLRAIHEKLLPALAKKADAEKVDYRDILAAALEAAAEHIGLDRWQIYAETELLSAVGGEGALDWFVGEGADSLRPPRESEPESISAERREWSDDHPLRVCLLNDSFPPVVDGVANAVVNYARVLSAGGDEVTVATPAYPDAVDDYPFRVVRYPSIDTTKMAGYRAGNPFAPAVAGELTELGFDIIHSHCPVSSSILARVLRESVHAPVIFTYHTKFDVDIENTVNSPLLQETAVKLLVNNISASDEVWVVSRGAGENLRSLGYEGEYVVMPNGVDLSRGRAGEEAVAALNEKWALPAGAPVYLFLGRIMWYKGLRIILDGLKKLHESGQDFCMVFVGDGMDRAEVEDYARELGLYEKCRFVGAEQDREVIRAWYTRADLFLFPSTFDTNGLVVREAAACSLGSLLIRGSCAAEDVTEGRNGILIEENADSLAAALAAGNRELFRSVGQHACSEIYVSWDDAVARARARYLDVLDRWDSGELRRKRTRFDGFFDLTGDLAEMLERSKEALDRLF